MEALTALEIAYHAPEKIARSRKCNAHFALTRRFTPWFGGLGSPRGWLSARESPILTPSRVFDVSRSFIEHRSTGMRPMPPDIYAIATMDTKGDELAYVVTLLRAGGGTCVTVDVSTTGGGAYPADVTRETVAAMHPRGASYVLEQQDRGQAVAAMSESLAQFLRCEHEAGRVSGAIGLGGSGGTALIAPALRALPIGLPKVIVSTVASGNTAAYIGQSDLILMPSVVDVAGLNTVSRPILANAAQAILGMVRQRTSLPTSTRPAVGLTMFGVTTPCVTAVRQSLEADGYDCLVFHATGTGGQTMERLVAEGLITGVIDVTTTEVADEVVGGVFPAGPARFEAILAARVPYVLSVGALDMVNFGAMETVPPQFRDRRLHVHNSQVTLLRTTPDENRRCARWMADKLNRSTALLQLLIPERGVSMLDAPGQPFFDPKADEALFGELESAIEQTPARKVRRLPHHINDREFAAALVEAFRAAVANR